MSLYLNGDIYYDRSDIETVIEKLEPFDDNSPAEKIEILATVVDILEDVLTCASEETEE